MMTSKMTRNIIARLGDIMSADKEGLVLCQHGTQWLYWGGDVVIASTWNFSSPITGEEYVSDQGREEEGVSYEGREDEEWQFVYREEVKGK